ncbi:hypothetical protein AgCh_014801 [Apium graveolens]
MVPTGDLFPLVQKGFQHFQLEANVNCNDAEIVGGSSFLQPPDPIAKDAYESEELMKETKDSVPETKHREKEKGIDVFKSKLDREHLERGNDNASEKMEKQNTEKERELEDLEEKKKMAKTAAPHAELTDAKDEKLNMRKT